MNVVGLFSEDTEQDKLVNQISARAPQEPMPKFPEVRGLCRTCGNGLIFRREYSEVPIVRCQAYGASGNQMPLDIKECTSYLKRGGLSLREMTEMAILLDERKHAGGQYL